MTDGNRYDLLPSPRISGCGGRQFVTKRVVLSFPLRLGPWSDIVRGVYRYVDSRVPWVIALSTDDDVAVPLAAKPDGVIAMVRTTDAAAKFKAWGGPVVDTACDLDGLPFTQVRLDPEAIGRTAADHLLVLRGRHYAYLGDPSTPAGRRSGEGFIRRLRRARHGCAVAPAGAFDTPYHSNPASERAAVAWVATLPRPVAVFCAHDALAHRVADACCVAGLTVPGDVAILGTLNDEFLCTASRPPLSSIACPLPVVGFQAARVLDRMMHGRPAPRRPLELPPVGVVVRQSTDPAEVADPHLAAALRFIRDHAAERVGVREIAGAVGLSRSTLERRFRAALGHAPLAELLGQRIERARHLLAATDLAIKEIALLAGFHDARHLSATFRHKVGVSPKLFRDRFHAG